MTATSIQVATAHSKSLALAMRVGSDALADICGTMFGIDIELVAELQPLDAEGTSCAGCVTLFHESGSWELGLYGDDATTTSLAREILSMGPEEAPDDAEILDALGEVVNMVAGATKAKLSETTRGEIHITAPMFFTGKDCQKHQPVAIPVHAQGFTNERLGGLLYFTLLELTPLAMVSEIDAILEHRQPEDKLGLVQAISHFQGLIDVLPPSVSPRVRDLLESCENVITDVVNEHLDGSRGIKGVREVVEALKIVLDPSAPEISVEDIPDPRSACSASGESSIALVQVERDAEMLEMLADFLQETEEGLESVDGILIDIEGGNNDPEEVNRLFRIYHSMKGVASFLELSEATTLGHRTETLLAMVRDGTYSLQGGVLDLIFDSTEAARALLTNVECALEAGTEIPSHAALVPLLRNLDRAIAGETVERSVRSDPSATSGSAAGPAPAAASGSEKKGVLKQVLKVDLDLVEELESAVEQLSRFGASATELADLFQSDDQAFEEIGTVYACLRAISVKIRMVSLASAFQKMTRMVRDLSKKTEKLIKVVVSGEETRVPRHVVDGLNDALVHMIRNAVDHGIESQEERAISGKPMLATIRLTASTREGDIVVQITEDGRGMDREKLIAKARANGIIEPDAQLSDQEAFALIFAPGFSTAAAVTAISGRGVGMDVVKRNIEGMGGRIEIDSGLGRGTSFSLILPMVPRGR